jgi:hypothetical protein
VAAVGFLFRAAGQGSSQLKRIRQRAPRVVAAIRHFRYMLEGRGSVVFTDHKLQVGVHHRQFDPVSVRQQRHLSFIAKFAPTIRHITGDSNIMADTLSHPTTASSCPGVADKRSTEVKEPSGSSVPPAHTRVATSSPAHWSGGPAFQQPPCCRWQPWRGGYEVDRVKAPPGSPPSPGHAAPRRQSTWRHWRQNNRLARIARGLALLPPCEFRRFQCREFPYWLTRHRGYSSRWYQPPFADPFSMPSTG